MLQMKLSITIIFFILSCFGLNSVQANSSFPNALPKVQKEATKDKSTKKGIRTFFKKIKKQLRQTAQRGKKQNRNFSNNTTKNRYGKIALWAFILCPISLFSIYFIYGYGLLFAIIFNIVSFVAARRGVNGKDENPKLAETIFSINLTIYALAVLIIGWFFVLNFL
jgi:predicted secreted protein